MTSLLDVQVTHDQSTLDASASETFSSTNPSPAFSPKDLYVRFLQSLYLIYSALEHELLNAHLTTYPLNDVLHADQLFRRSALSRDLTYFLGVGWKSKLTSTRAADAYVTRIREVAKADPDLLLAHHSARYIGDLQTCEKSLVRTRRLIGPPSGNRQNSDADSNPAAAVDLNAGVAFHVFENVKDKEKFQTDYFSRIRGFDLSPELNRKIAKEAKVVYQLNLNVYWELQNVAPKADETQLDSRYQSLLSLDGDNTNRKPATSIDSSFMQTNELVEAESCGDLDEFGVPCDNSSSKIRCRGLPLFCYSLLFWFSIWFVIGFVFWRSDTKSPIMFS